MMLGLGAEVRYRSGMMDLESLREGFGILKGFCLMVRMGGLG